MISLGTQHKISSNFFKNSGYKTWADIASPLHFHLVGGSLETTFLPFKYHTIISIAEFIT
jgi:hypothetical protein